MLFKAATEAQKAVNYILKDETPNEEVADTQNKALKEA